jgi:hypothetical protein
LDDGTGFDVWRTGARTIRRAEAADSAVYIEVVTAPDEAPPFSLRLQEYTRSMCRARSHC